MFLLIPYVTVYFFSDLKPEEIDVSTAGPAVGGAIEFREDMDVLEQVRIFYHRSKFSRGPRNT